MHDFEIEYPFMALFFLSFSEVIRSRFHLNIVINDIDLACINTSCYLWIKGEKVDT